MNDKTLSPKEALIEAAEIVGSRAKLADLLGIPRSSVNYAICRNVVSPDVARKLDVIVSDFRCDVYLPNVFSPTMMLAERRKFLAV